MEVSMVLNTTIIFFLFQVKKNFFFKSNLYLPSRLCFNDVKNNIFKSNAIEKRVMIRTKRDDSFRELRRFSITFQKEKTRMTIKIQNRFVRVETTSVLNLSRRERRVKIFTHSWPALNKKFTRKTGRKNLVLNLTCCYYF